jgi:hypothetical protein
MVSEPHFIKARQHFIIVQLQRRDSGNLTTHKDDVGWVGGANEWAGRVGKGGGSFWLILVCL